MNSTDILIWLNDNSGVLNSLTCIISLLAAIAAWSQVKEMRRQYAEENRPHIEVEFLYLKRTFYGLRFVNHGKCTAQNVMVQLDADFIDTLPEEKFAALLRQQKDKSCVIGVGQHYDLFIGTNVYLHSKSKLPAKGKIRYTGNGNEYEDDFFIDVENYATIFSTNSDQEDLLSKLNDQSKALNEIKNAIKELNKK